MHSFRVLSLRLHIVFSTWKVNNSRKFSDNSHQVYSPAESTDVGPVRTPTRSKTVLILIFITFQFSHRTNVNALSFSVFMADARVFIIEKFAKNYH